MALKSISQLKTADLEDAIRQVRDVISVKVVPDSIGGVAEIHILAGPHRGPKQIVRDIESMMIAHFGVVIDHKKISIAQLQDDNLDFLQGRAAKASGTGIRPRLAGVTAHSGGRVVETRVELEIGGVLYEGSAVGPSSVTNKHRLVSQATLNALETYLKGTTSFVADDISFYSIAGERAMAVAVSLVTDRGEEILTGSAFIKDDEREAAAKATLAAINRRITLIG